MPDAVRLVTASRASAQRLEPGQARLVAQTPGRVLQRELADVAVDP